jgi:hypothetical protein
VEDFVLGVVHIVLIRGYNWKKVNITLKIESDIHFGTIVFCKLFTNCGIEGVIGLEKTFET